MNYFRTFKFDNKGPQLIDFLKQLTKSDLDDFRSKLKIPGLSKLNKSQLAQAISEQLSSGTL